MESGFLLFLMPLAVRHIRHTRTKRGSMATRAVIATIRPASAIPATPRVRHRVGVRVHAGGSAVRRRRGARQRKRSRARCPYRRPSCCRAAIRGAAHFDGAHQPADHRGRRRSRAPGTCCRARRTCICRGSTSVRETRCPPRSKRCGAMTVSTSATPCRQRSPRSRCRSRGCSRAADTRAAARSSAAHCRCAAAFPPLFRPLRANNLESDRFPSRTASARKRLRMY